MKTASRRLRPGLLIGGARGGAGKTVVTIGIARALHRRGITVGPFKKGPDYIDPAWLTLATERPCHNLDTFLMSRDAVKASFEQHHTAADLVLVEGNRGLHDGMDASGAHSSATLAKQLGLPLILVVDCTKMTRTAAAMVLGCQLLDPEIKLGGVALNRLAGKRHEGVIRDAIKRHCDIPVIGAIPRIESLAFWERHLGLMPVAEHPDALRVVDEIADMIEQTMDLDQVQEIARGAVPLVDNPLAQASAGASLKPRIGVIRDAAFNFYYPENLQALEELGAELVFFSALDKALPPELDAVYIGGGFPETSAQQLADNESFRRDLRAKIEQGLPVYAECGGLTYLSESIAVGDETFPMVGVFPVSFEVAKKPQGHGYTIAEIDRPNPFFPVGQVLRGHEFRYLRVCQSDQQKLTTVFQMRRGAGFAEGRDGLCYKNVLAAFCHLHALGAPSWATGLFGQACRRMNERSAGGAGAREVEAS